MRDLREAFTDEQATLLEERSRDIVNREFRRIVQLGALAAVAIAIGFGYGLHQVGESSDHADAANRAVAALNRERAIDAKASAKQAAENAYAACRRQQESAGTTREFLHLTIPRHDATRSRELQAEVNRFYRRLEAQQLFSVPKCPKPPKGGE